MEIAIATGEALSFKPFNSNKRLMIFQILTLIALFAHQVNASQLHSVLNQIDEPHPFCQRSGRMSLADDYFVEIANQVDGVDAYNQLIKFYEGRRWAELTDGIKRFQIQYGSSPLKEALSFLSFQARLDQVKQYQGEAWDDLDQEYRKLLLLYPESSLVPVITVSFADQLLVAGQYQSALGMFEKAKLQYNDPGYQCAFRVGSAEGMFMLAKWNDAKNEFDSLAKQCANPKVTFWARMRSADVDFLRGRRELAKVVYEKLYRENPTRAIYLHPPILANLAEILYWQKDYTKARYFIKEFRKVAGPFDPCVAKLIKREADIVFNLKEAPEKVVGLYLVTHDKMPHDDVGRFSYIRALLLGLKGQSTAEVSRRIKVIDDEITQIKDVTWKNKAHLERGLFILEFGEQAAIDYLLKLSHRREFNLTQGVVGDFIRQHIYEILLKRVEGIKDSEPKSLKASEIVDVNELKVLEDTQGTWFAKTKDTEKLNKIYQSFALEQTVRAFKANDTSGGFSRMAQWAKSPMMGVLPLKGKSKQTLMQAILVPILALDPAIARNPVELYKQGHSNLQLALGDDTILFSLITAYFDQDSLAIQALLKKRSPSFWMTVLKSTTIAKASLQMVLFDVFYSQGNYLQAKKLIPTSGEESKKYLWSARSIKLASATSDWPTYYRLVMKHLEEMPVTERASHLTKLQTIAWDSGLWAEASSLRTAAEKSGIEGADLAPFYYLSAKSSVRQKACAKAIPDYEKALELSSASAEGMEARFKLGTCLWQAKQKEKAREVWTNLVNLNDPFWSPLAKNELSLAVQSE